MKRLIYFAVIAVLAIGAYNLADARYLLDEYFGVDLSLNSSTGQFNMPWTPTTGDMMHANWGTDGDAYAPDPGPHYYVSEVFDLEAMYLDVNQASNELVFSIVTSMPNTGFNQVSWYPGYVFRAGDIRFNTGGGTYVLGTFGNTYGNLYYNPTMTYTDGYRGFAQRGNPILGSGNTVASNLGNAFSYHEYLTSGGSSVIENGYSTYLMEGRIPLASLGGGNIGGDLSMSLAMSCNNDMGTVVSSVPEPATLTMLGFGLVGLYGATRRRRAAKPKQL